MSFLGTISSMQERDQSSLKLLITISFQIRILKPLGSTFHRLIISVSLKNLEENVLMPLQMHSSDFQLLAKFEKYYILLLIHATPPSNTKTYFIPFETHEI